MATGRLLACSHPQKVSNRSIQISKRTGRCLSDQIGTFLSHPTATHHPGIRKKCLLLVKQQTSSKTARFHVWDFNFNHFPTQLGILPHPASRSSDHHNRWAAAIPCHPWWLLVALKSPGHQARLDLPLFQSTKSSIKSSLAVRNLNKATPVDKTY